MQKTKIKDKEGVKEKTAKVFSKIISAISLFLYNIGVAIHSAFHKKDKIKKSKTKQKYLGGKLFYACVLVLPMLQFLIFYVVVNINSIVLSFQQYDKELGKFVFLGFDNFITFLKGLIADPIIIQATKNSLLLYLSGLLIGLPLNLVFSFFLYKKIALSGFFRVVLFLPQIISTMVISLMFKYFVESALPDIMQLFGISNLGSLITQQSTSFPTIIFYVLWSSFGTQILIYNSAMSRVPDSLVEVGKLEGISMFTEFRKITLPLIFPTITTFLVVGIAGIFTAQAGLYDFFGSSAPYHTYTYGYYLFVRVIGDANIVNYPLASAAGLIFTLIAAPITLLAKYLLEKFGPSVEY